MRSLWLAGIMFGILILSISVSFAADSPSGFEVDSVFLKTAIKTGSSLDNQIKITNLRDSASNFEIKIIDLGKVASVETEKFDLNPKETKSVYIVFSAVNISEGIYVGKIEILSEQEEKDIPIVLEVESKDVLFDSNINLFPREEIYAGDKINAEIKIFDLSKIGTSSIELSYFVKNFQGKTIISETESLVVDDMTSITKSFDLPKDVEAGDYIFGAILKYKNSVGSSSIIFQVIEEEKPSISLISNRYVIILVGIIVFAVLFVLFSEYERKKMKNVLKIQRTEIKNIRNDIKKTKGLGLGSSSIKRKISQQRAALEKAFDAGYISHDSYEKGKKRLQNLGKGFK